LDLLGTSRVTERNNKILNGGIDLWCLNLANISVILWWSVLLVEERGVPVL
jgi:hypothetical protein